MQALDNYINEIKTLPPAPKVLARLLTLLSQEDADAGQIVDLIAIDPALTAKVLQRCNNAASGLAAPVCDLDDAVGLVGFNAIYRLVAMVIGESVLSRQQRAYGLGPGALWEHSAITGVAAKVLAAKLGGDENLAFTAALLHDIGKLVLGAFLEDSQQSIPRLKGPSGLSFLEAEKSVLGVQHAEIGGRVLEAWNFPKNLVTAVWYHHDPTQGQLHEQLAAYVHLGDVIAYCVGQDVKFESYAGRTQPEALQILEISPREMDMLVGETDTALLKCGGFVRTKS
jgi:putative nucleotidyltransferase with HDIG domain